MKQNYTFIDCDGVILDSEQRMLKMKEQRGFLDHHNSKEFTDYFKIADSTYGEWEYIISGASSLNNSVEIIRELEKMKKNIAILTKIHSLKEMQIKVHDLRTNRHITSPILFVPPNTNKHDIILPNGQLLIDDSIRNISGWIEHGGEGLIFDESIKENSKTKVKSLDFLLRR